MPGIKDLPYAERAPATERARRIARFKAQLARARKAVETEPRLTDDERAEIARIWLAGPDGGRRDHRGTAVGACPEGRPGP